MRQVVSTIASSMRLAARSCWATVSRRGSVLWLTLSGALLVAGIFVATIVTVGEFRERALVNSERELENTVLLLTRHFDQQFEDSEIVAADLIAQMNLSDITSPEMFNERMSSAEARRMLTNKIGAVNYLGDIAIYDANGDIINWSRNEPLPKINISSRAYFQTFKSNPQSEPVLLETVRSFLIGKWTTVVGRQCGSRRARSMAWAGWVRVRSWRIFPF
ncbi:hypothetical protein ACVWXO_002726 [Bradyrhizobium sp. LM2.7]